MSKAPKNIEELRDYALQTLAQLKDGEIDTAQAGVVGKVCETVISTIKSQMEYGRMIGEEPVIPFMQDSHEPKALEGNVSRKQLDSPSFSSYHPSHAAIKSS